MQNVPHMKKKFNMNQKHFCIQSIPSVNIKKHYFLGNKRFIYYTIFVEKQMLDPKNVEF